MITGEKIVLRPINEDDTKNIIKWRNTESVRRNFCVQDLLTEEMHLNWYNNKVKKGEVIQFIIIDKATNQPVGSTFLRDVDYKNKKAEFGIFIGEDSARGKGLGSEAAMLISDFGFNDLKLHKIFLRVFKDNLGGVNAYAKAGFKLEGTFVDDIIVNDSYKTLIFMAKFNKVI